MKRHGFTLIELLAVIAIAGIMLGIGVVAFTKMGQATKLQTAGSNLVNTMELARQYAITHRVYTYVLFPTDGTQVTTNFARPYTSYAVVTTNSTYLTAWKTLPDGLVFDFTQWASGGGWSEANPYALGNDPGKLVPNTGVRKTTFNIASGGVSVNQEAPYLAFSPTAGNYYNVFIRNGYYVPGGNPPVNFTPPGTVTNVNFVEAVVAWPTGRIFQRKK